MRLNLKKNMFGNMLLNTVAAAVPVFVLQLVILPYIGRLMNGEQYGLLITILSVLNVVPATLGNSLNNIRMLYDGKYKENNLNGDFALIFVSESFVNIIVVAILSFYYLQCNIDVNTICHLLLISVLSLLWICREYYTVAFLIDLRYDYILLNNILLALGYILGIALFTVTGYWETIYLTGYGLSTVYIFSKTDMWKEKFTKTIFFNKVLFEEIVYIIACLLFRITVYADKMIIYPVLGGAEVAVYYVATLSGKIVSLLITPISSVMLAYLAKYSVSEGKKSLRSVIKTGSVVCLLGYIVCLLISRPCLSVLYPQYVKTAMLYIPITTATVVVGVMISVINPYLLRYQSMKWQMFINIVTAAIYVGSSLLLLIKYGLMGFCFGCLLANVVKLIIMLLIYYFACPNDIAVLGKKLSGHNEALS